MEKTASEDRAFGVAILVACFEDLIASKLSARREKDLRLLPEIERLRRLLEQGCSLAGPASRIFNGYRKSL
jgi:hypothetical protein